MTELVIEQTKRNNELQESLLLVLGGVVEDGLVGVVDFVQDTHEEIQFRVESLRDRLIEILLKCKIGLDSPVEEGRNLLEVDISQVSMADTGEYGTLPDGVMVMAKGERKVSKRERKRQEGRKKQKEDKYGCEIVCGICKGGICKKTNPKHGNHVCGACMSKGLF